MKPNQKARTETVQEKLKDWNQGSFIVWETQTDFLSGVSW